MQFDPSKFDEIRPYGPGEMKQAMRQLLADRQFNVILKGLFPAPKWLRNGLIRAAFIGVNTPLQFQMRFMRPVVRHLLKKCSKGVTFSYRGIAPGPERYTFVSNHRDIVLDSAILSVELNRAGFPTTVEIAIGDNLLIYPWIRTLVRMNKAFTVRRGLSARELLQSSQLMSEYMHYAIQQKKENIWIAQREGRAKDSSDQTQESVLKMMAMGGEGSVTERLKQLNIVPLTISYEYDPCDYLKAMEFQLKRDNPQWKKSRQDDLDNMKTGIKGQKGRIHYEAAPCINLWLDEYAELPRTEIFKAIALRMDKDIHQGYHLFPGNYVAADLLSGSDTYSKNYTAEDKKTFENYLQSRLDMIQIPDKDEPFLRERILTMYANPVRNKLGRALRVEG